MWKLIGSGTYTTGEQGAEALYAFDVQDFGLQVDTVLFALEVEAASSGTVQVRLHEDHGASPDFEGYVTSGVDPIAATPVGEPVVQTLLPISAGVDAAALAEQLGQAVSKPAIGGQQPDGGFGLFQRGPPWRVGQEVQPDRLALVGGIGPAPPHPVDGLVLGGHGCHGKDVLEVQ